MNILGLALFTLQILLETYIFPNHSSEYISPKIFYILTILLTIYKTRSQLKKQSSYMTIIVLIANAILRKYLFSYYYPTKPRLDLVFELILGFLIAISFIFASQKDFEEIEESKIIPDIRKFICSLVFSNGSAFYYENYTFSGISKNSEFDFKILSEIFVERIFADFIILNGIFIICDLINYSTKRDNSHIKAIFKYFAFNFILTVVYFAIFNENISSKIYELLFAHISKPYNIIIYNMFAYPAVVKFKIAFTSIFYLI